MVSNVALFNPATQKGDASGSRRFKHGRASVFLQVERLFVNASGERRWLACNNRSEGRSCAGAAAAVRHKVRQRPAPHHQDHAEQWVSVRLSATEDSRHAIGD